jgi:integrase
MAEVSKRVWRSGPRKVRHSAWGFTLQVDGKQVKTYRESWTREDAEQALAARLLERDAPLVGQVSLAAPVENGMTFGEAISRYLEVKKTKRGWKDDQRNLIRLRGVFDAALPLRDLTAGRIAEYKVQRARTLVRRDGRTRPISAATLNRELAVLRHLLQLAVKEWEVLDKAPHIRLEKEPEGRIKWLEPKEEAALLAACGRSQNPHLVAIITVALESGMRQGELLGLTWDRVDLSRGVMQLERTKSGKRREVPMREVVYAIFAAMPEPRVGRVWPDRSMRRAFENAVETAELTDFTFHDCRHHFASWFMMRGRQLEALRAILGHRDIKMTLRYAHLSPSHLRTEIDKTATPVPVSASAHGQRTGGKIGAGARVTV